MKKSLAATFLSGAMFCANLGQSDAMPIPTFDQMADEDQSDYLLQMIAGSMDYLKAHGTPDVAEQVRNYFIIGNGHTGPGVDAFLKNLEGARQVNRLNVDNPDKKQLQVEDAFALTLKHDGVIVPVDALLAIGQDFHPALPPRPLNSGTTTNQ